MPKHPYDKKPSPQGVLAAQEPVVNMAYCSGKFEFLLPRLCIYKDFLSYSVHADISVHFRNTDKASNILQALDRVTWNRTIKATDS